MALSDELHRLADRAEEAERNAAAAKGKAKTDLEQDRERSREIAKQQAEQLREAADAGHDKISSWWNDVQRNWNEHIAQLQENVQAKKAEIDLDTAQRRAYNAEADANFAIEFAYSAIGEAEYAVLDADLARKEADELAATGVGA
jgi:flagellar biosynthesis chaperone FliJ